MLSCHRKDGEASNAVVYPCAKSEIPSRRQINALRAGLSGNLALGYPALFLYLYHPAFASMVRIVLVVLLLFTGSALVLPAQNRLPAFEMNERLGRGINIGNTFEAPTETEWGNPW